MASVETTAEAANEPLSSVRFERDGMRCEPLYFVDGEPKGRLSRLEAQALENTPHKRAVIYQAGREPAQFRDPEKCGAVVITTK